MSRVRATLLALAVAVPVFSQEPAEILIRNAEIVTETGRLQGDLRIRGGEIAEIGRNLIAARGARALDATGKLVLPGGIDTHVHLNPVRTPSAGPGADDFESASRAALAGGITTYPRKGVVAVGADADVVIWDPNLRRTIRDDDILSNGKFSIFSGWEVTGWPIVTIRRGQVVYENGKS
jgi:dihydroorotase-like cyclic amidohydrolase